MTESEFFKKLPRDGWYLKDRRLIRQTNDDACPINKVCGLGGAEYPMKNGLDLGILPGLVDEIIYSADHPEETRLRRRLLEHCKLKAVHGYYTRGMYAV